MKINQENKDKEEEEGKDKNKDDDNDKNLDTESLNGAYSCLNESILPYP